MSSKLFTDPGVNKVFEKWRTYQLSPSRVRLSPVRQDLIMKRMKKGYTPEDLCLLIEYAFEAETQEAKYWRTNGYTGLDNLLRLSKLDDRLDNANVWAGIYDEQEPA